MARELPAYRDNLEDILAYFGGKRMLCIKEVAGYLGRSDKWVKQNLGVTKAGISAMTLARKLSED